MIDTRPHRSDGLRHLVSWNHGGVDVLGRLRSVPPWLVDVCLAATLAAAITTAIALATEFESRTPDVLAYALGISIAA